MVTVLVGDEDGVDVIDIYSGGGQHVAYASTGKPGVDEHKTLGGLQQRAVSGTAASEDGDLARHGWVDDGGAEALDPSPKCRCRALCVALWSGVVCSQLSASRWSLSEKWGWRHRPVCLQWVEMNQQEAGKKTLVIGSGGREHALVKACLQSSLVREVIAAPGNGGISQDARCVPLDVEDIDATVELVRVEKVDFVIVGPEVPLALGVADALRETGVAVYGPGAEAARLESSKVFSKAFLERHGIPTARAQAFTELKAAVEHLARQRYPVVIKASGLAAGKGVVIAEDFETAEGVAADMLVRNRFRESGHEILIEEFMSGEEASIMLMVCGDRYVMLPPSQDHKRVGEGDIGPNTGGMGAYAPTGAVDTAVRQRIIETIIEPTLKGLAGDGIDYRGTLYIGIMVEAGQPRVVEFNVRFGDPECQILLPLLHDDPVGIMLACAEGRLEPTAVRVGDRSAVIVVLAARGYPGKYTRGGVITLPASLPDNVAILHAGTSLDSDGMLRASGGRVLGVVATGDDLRAAREAAYAVCDAVDWEDKQFRRDIGWRELRRSEGV